MSEYRRLTEQAISLIEDGRWDEAVEELKMLEAGGNGNAIAVLAGFYLYGVGVAKDVERALELFEKAVVFGCADAAWELGSLYYSNDAGLRVDKRKAVELFEEGARQGHAECCGELARCYLRGEGTSVNEQKAFEYAMLGAKRGSETGMLYAAICYDDGIGTDQDPYAACYWYKEYLNLEPEDDAAMLRVALCLADPYERFGISPTGEMLDEAFHYAGKAVESGNVEAHLIIGWFYERGEVVQQDFDMAHKYIEIAANNGDGIAQEHIKIFRKNIYGNYYIPGNR